jgi:hypothetical protein
LVVVAPAAVLVGDRFPAEDGDRQAGAHVCGRAGEVGRVVLGYDLAGVGPVVAEVERVGERDADPGESGAL